MQELQFALTKQDYENFADRLTGADVTVVDTFHTVVEHLRNPSDRDRESFQGQIIHLERRYDYRRDLQDARHYLHVSACDQEMAPIDQQLVSLLEQNFRRTPIAPSAEITPQQPTFRFWPIAGWLVAAWICFLLLMGCGLVFRWF